MDKEERQIHLRLMNRAHDRVENVLHLLHGVEDRRLIRDSMRLLYDNEVALIRFMSPRSFISPDRMKYLAITPHGAFLQWYGTLSSEQSSLEQMNDHLKLMIVDIIAHGDVLTTSSLISHMVKEMRLYEY